MDTLYFYVVRECAQTLISTNTLPIKSSDKWLELLKEIEPMNFGRLLCFYAYMKHCNVTLNEQYEFHKLLYKNYPVHYPSIWWMLGQIIKGRG